MVTSAEKEENLTCFGHLEGAPERPQFGEVEGHSCLRGQCPHSGVQGGNGPGCSRLHHLHRTLSSFPPRVRPSGPLCFRCEVANWFFV